MTVAREKCGQAEVTWFDQSTATLHSASLRAELLLGAKPLPTRLSWEEILKSDYSVANTGFITQATEWTKALFALSLAGVGVVLNVLTGANSANLLSASKLMLVLAIVSLAVTAASSVMAFEASGNALQEELRAAREGRAPGIDRLAAHLDMLKAIQVRSFYFGLAVLCFFAFTQATLK